MSRLCWAPDGKTLVPWPDGAGFGLESWEDEMQTKIVKTSEMGDDWRASAHVYYPEMGGQPDRSRLFQRASHVGRFTFVDWAPERDAEARAVFKRLKVRPVITRSELVKGGYKFTARMTGAAWHKVQAEGDVSIEALL